MEVTGIQGPPVFEPQYKQHQKSMFLTAVLVRDVPVHTAAKVVGVARSTGYRWLRLYRRGQELDILDRRYGPDSVMNGIRKARGEMEDMNEF